MTQKKHLPKGLQDLKDPLNFLKETHTPDDAGGYKSTWAPAYKCFAKTDPILPAKNMHYWQAAQKQTRILYRVWVRYTSVLKGEMRIEWLDESYEILTAPLAVGNRKWLYFMMEKIT